MKEDNLGKNVCTAAAETGEGKHELADLHDIAETYLLESQQLPRDFEVGPMRDLLTRWNYTYQEALLTPSQQHRKYSLMSKQERRLNKCLPVVAYTSMWKFCTQSAFWRTELPNFCLNTSA